MLAEVPVALLPAHRGRIERRQERGGGCRHSGWLEIAGEHVAAGAVEVDLCMGHGGERGAGLLCRPAGPPADVRFRAGPERLQPARQQLGLRDRRVELLDLLAQPGDHRRPPVLPADPRASRPPTYETALHRELRQDARAGALGCLEPAADAQAQLFGEYGHGGDDLSRRGLAELADRLQRRLRGSGEPRSRPGRDPTVSDEPLEPAPLACRDRPRRGGIDDRHQVSWNGEERPPHAEHANEAALLVEASLDVGGRDALGAGEHREVDGHRIGRVEYDDCADRVQRLAASLRRRDPVASDEACPPLLDDRFAARGSSTSGQGLTSRYRRY